MRTFLTLALLLASAPALAGEMYLAQCDGFATRVLVGVGRVEAGLGVAREAFWCPASQTVASYWVAGEKPLARELQAIAASDRPAEEVVPVKPEVAEMLGRVSVRTVGELRGKLTLPSPAGLRVAGCAEPLVPLSTFTDGQEFPLCTKGRLEMVKLPVAWD